MSVIIANFGQENYLWPKCLQRGTVATIEDSNARKYSLAGDLEGYVTYSMRHIKTVRGKSPVRGVATRWYNTAQRVSSSSHDVWIHRHGHLLWWTTTTDDAAQEELLPAQIPSYKGHMVYEIHKPTTPWSSQDRTGRPLEWASIHPKATDFLFTEGTIAHLKPDSAEYVHALLLGADLSAWHDRQEWKAKLKAAKQAPVIPYSPTQVAAMNMVRMAMETAAHSNGQTVERKVKNKEHRFESEEEFRRYVEALLLDQEHLCAVSGLRFQYQDNCEDREMLPSLDRIDSSGHYERENLQVVCRFINRWKSDDDNANFVRLIAVVQGARL